RARDLVRRLIADDGDLPEELAVGAADAAGPHVIDALHQHRHLIRQVRDFAAREPGSAGTHRAPRVGEAGAGDDLVHQRARGVVATVMARPSISNGATTYPRFRSMPSARWPRFAA